MTIRKLFIVCVTLFCSAVTAWAEDYIACYSFIEKMSSPGVVDGERRAYLKILNRSEDAMQIQIDKFMTPFREYFTITTDAKLHSGKYIFTFTDGWDNEGKGFFKFEGDNKVELSIEMTKKNDIYSSVGRLYGNDTLSKCVGEEYMDNDFWKTATVEQIKAALNSGELKLTYHDGDQVTVFMLAAEYSPSPEVIQEFIKAGADVNERDRYKNTVLMYAADGRNPDVIKELLKAGAKLDDRDHNDKTALMHYLEFNKQPDTATIKALLKAGAEVNAKSDKLETALIIAVQYSESPETILTLLKAGADPSIKNNEGLSAWDYIRVNKSLLNTKAYTALDRAHKGNKYFLPKACVRTVLHFVLFALFVQLTLL